jgi:hypothetical protein
MPPKELIVPDAAASEYLSVPSLLMVTFPAADRPWSNSSVPPAALWNVMLALSPAKRPVVPVKVTSWPFVSKL